MEAKSAVGMLICKIGEQIQLLATFDFSSTKLNPTLSQTREIELLKQRHPITYQFTAIESSGHTTNPSLVHRSTIKGNMLNCHLNVQGIPLIQVHMQVISREGSSRCVSVSIQRR
jgi:hypothetical protein